MSNEEQTQAGNRPLPKLNQPEAIVFDMDGTLFQTESLLLPAYHKMFDILREEGLHSGPTPPEERILGSLGMLLADIWKNVMPEADEAVHRRADELLLQLEIEGLEAGGTVLYPKVVETLRALHARGVKLFVASNGLEDYIHSIVVVHEPEGPVRGAVQRRRLGHGNEDRAARPSAGQSQDRQCLDGRGPFLRCTGGKGQRTDRDRLRLCRLRAAG